MQLSYKYSRRVIVEGPSCVQKAFTGVSTSIPPRDFLRDSNFARYARPRRDRYDLKGNSVHSVIQIYSLLRAWIVVRAFVDRVQSEEKFLFLNDLFKKKLLDFFFNFWLKKK